MIYSFKLHAQLDAAPSNQTFKHNFWNYAGNMLIGLCLKNIEILTTTDNISNTPQLALVF